MKTTIGTCFIKSLIHTSPIILEESAVLHQLDAAWLQAGPTLGAVIQHCQLQVLGFINNS
jgi:hypothetical protein